MKESFLSDIRTVTYKKLNDKHRKGIIGEQAATEYILKQGYVLLEKNWSRQKSEIDIIAMHQDVMVFIEVKARTSDGYGSPEQTVDAKKEKLMAQGAAVYMQEAGHEWSIRFDVIAILLDSAGLVVRLEHFQDAFFPGLA